MHACTRTDVDQEVRCAYGFFIVLHHEHGIAEIPQVGQRAQEALVVALMQADGRFVEDVHHTHQAGTNLARQANTLRLTARQCFRAAVEREVVQADVYQELKARLNLLENLVGNRRALTFEFEFREIVERFLHGAGRDLRQRGLSDEHVP